MLTRETLQQRYLASIIIIFCPLDSLRFAISKTTPFSRNIKSFIAFILHCLIDLKQISNVRILLVHLLDQFEFASLHFIHKICIIQLVEVYSDDLKYVAFSPY